MLLVLIVIELDISSKILKFREIGECSATFWLWAKKGLTEVPFTGHSVSLLYIYGPIDYRFSLWESR